MSTAVYYEFGPFSLNGQERVLRRGGSIVTMPPKAMATLLVLAKADGRVTSKEEILTSVWPDTFVSEGTLTQTVFLLRRRLTSDSDEVSPIETIAGVGYRLRDPVVCVPLDRDLAEEIATDVPPLSESPPEQAAEPDETNPPPASVRPGWLVRHRILASAAGLSLVVAAALPALHRRPQALPTHPRIAVVAFRNLAPDTSTAWVASALRELVDANLNGGPAQIIPATTVDRAAKSRSLAAGAAPDPAELRQLCAELRCDALLIGSYLVTASQSRLDTQLLDGRTGATIRQSHTSSPGNDLVSLVGATEADLSSALHIPNDPRRTAWTAASVPAKFEAYRLYQEGMLQLRQFDPVLANQLLQRSIALDPSFPLSHMELSHALTLLGKKDEALKEVHTAASFADNLSPLDQLRVKATTQAVERDFDAAAATYGKLYAMVPEDPEYLRSQASLLENADHDRQAVDLLQAFVSRPQSAPVPPAIYLVLGQGYMNLGEFETARAVALKTQEEAKAQGDLVLSERASTAEAGALASLDKLEEALKTARQALELANRLGDVVGEQHAMQEITSLDRRKAQSGDATKMLQPAHRAKAVQLSQ